MPKPNLIKVFIFRKHFSHGLKKHIWFNMFLLMHFYLFYFFAQFMVKKVFRKLFLAYIFFAISDALFYSIWHKIYYEHKIWGLKVKKKKKKKKSKTSSFGLQKCQQEVISPKWLKIAKIWKIMLFVLNFSVPNKVRSSWSWSILRYWL